MVVHLLSLGDSFIRFLQGVWLLCDQLSLTLSDPLSALQIASDIRTWRLKGSASAAAKIWEGEGGRCDSGEDGNILAVEEPVGSLR